MNYRILIADDDKEIRDLLRLYLENQHYEVIEASDGEQALSWLYGDNIDLCLLDIGMPKKDGFEVLEEMRKENNIPVIILSARSEETDRVKGLQLGADDFISKPFNPLEVLARINSAIRRFYSLGTDEKCPLPRIRVRDLVLDQESGILLRNGTVINLTNTEYRIMALFMMNPGEVFTREQICHYAWEKNSGVTDNNVLVYISKLRGKLDNKTNKYIKTIRGLGYRMEP